MPTKNIFTVKGTILGQSSAGARKDFLTDALGSVTATANSAGSVERTFRYKPYGSQLSASGVGQDPSFRWVGRAGYRAASVDNVYVRARHYSPQTGSWTSVDHYWPSEAAYIYVRCRPVSTVDPSGKLDCETECAQWKQNFPKNVGTAGGGVICVEGVKCPCYWGDSKDPILKKCGLAHERDHFDDTECPKAGTCRPGFKQGANGELEECYAYHVHVKCLDANCPKENTLARHTCLYHLCAYCEEVQNRCKKAGFTPTPAVKEICKRQCGFIL